MKIAQLRQQIERLKGKQEVAIDSLKEARQELLNSQRHLVRTEQARALIQEVSLMTQKQLQYHISDITSSALETVFTDPYELDAQFVERRNKTECDLLFVRDGNESKPLDSSGGGAVDVAAFALRIASWLMKTPKSRNTIVLDEPLRFLSKDHQEQASKMIKELSQKLGLQFIIVTHEDTLTQYADKVFSVSIRKGVSHVNS